MVIDMVEAQNDGGFIYSDGLVEVKISNSQFNNLKADRGGFIYANALPLPAPISPAFLQFIGSTILTNLVAKTGGGGFYINNPHMNLYMNTPITVTNAKTTIGNGGVFFLESIKSIDFKQLTTGDIGTYKTLTVPHPSYGSFLYSQAVNSNIALEDLEIKCQDLPPDPTNPTEFIDFLEN